MITPKGKPKATRNDIEKYLTQHGIDVDEKKVVLVGVRGYYANTFGKPYLNDRNFYDDALFVVTPDLFMAFNANVDPSKYRSGIATLVEGIYEVVKWRHRGKYEALQIVQDRVTRDGKQGVDIGRHGINFHYGGSNDTWSEGCQTLPQSQYWAFQKLVYHLMDSYRLKSIKYLLVTNA